MMLGLVLPEGEESMEFLDHPPPSSMPLTPEATLAAPGYSSVFSGRVELVVDFNSLLLSLNHASQGTGHGLVKVAFELGFLEPGHFSGEAEVEFHFDVPVSIEWVESHIRAIDDAHVLLQTLKPCFAVANPMERDYDKH